MTADGSVEGFEVPVDVLPRPDRNDEDDQPIVEHGVDDPILTHSRSSEIVHGATDLGRAGPPWLGRQPSDGAVNTLPPRLRQFEKLLPRVSAELETIGGPVH